MSEIGRGRSRHLKFVFIAVALLAVGFFSRNRERLGRYVARVQHPYVVLVSIDTLHVNWTGLFNDNVDYTPFLDSFRDEGVVFENAYTQVPITLPSHAALMTGAAPSRLGVMRNGDVVPDGVTTVAELLEAAGYRTSAFVSLGVLSKTYGLDQGFADYSDPFLNDSDRWYRSADEILAPALSWLDEHHKDPFFMWLHLSDPHEPYLAVNAPPDTTLSLDAEPLSEWNLVGKKIHRTEVTLPPGSHRLSWTSQRMPQPDDRPETAVRLQLHSREVLEAYSSEALPAADLRIPLRPSFQLLLDNPTDSDLRVEIAFSGGLERPAPSDVLEHYAREVEYVDQHLRKLQAGFEKLGIAEDVLWVVVSDHGEGLFRHDLLGHASMVFEDQLRVLWLVKGPGMPAGLSIAAPVLLNDVSPTLLELLGLPVSPLDGLDGMSLSDCLDPEADCVSRKSWWSFGLSHETNGLTSMAGYEWPYKWVWFRGKPRMGFHLVEDAWEENDLLLDPGPDNPEALRTVAEQFRDQRRRLRDRLQKTATSGGTEEQKRLLRSLGYLGGRSQ